jgi:hypothetical protein
MRWVGHVASMGGMRNAYIYIGSENLKERDHSEHRGVDGRVILERVLWKLG